MVVFPIRRDQKFFSITRWKDFGPWTDYEGDNAAVAAELGLDPRRCWLDIDPCARKAAGMADLTVSLACEPRPALLALDGSSFETSFAVEMPDKYEKRMQRSLGMDLDRKNVPGIKARVLDSPAGRALRTVLFGNDIQGKQIGLRRAIEQPASRKGLPGREAYMLRAQIRGASDAAALDCEPLQRIQYGFPPRAEGATGRKGLRGPDRGNSRVPGSRLAALGRQSPQAQPHLKPNGVSTRTCDRWHCEDWRPPTVPCRSG